MPPFLTILFRPRDTMKRVLNGPRRHVIVLAILAIASSMLNEMQKREIVRAPALQSTQMALFIVAVIAISVLALLLVFYGLSWVAVGAGRLLDGTGEPRDVRAALAWGCMPIIFAIAYRLPSALFIEHPEALRADRNWLPLIMLGVLEIAVFTWWLITTSNTLAVAHRFSTARGFATLLLMLAAPFVLAIAAVLTFAT